MRSAKPNSWARTLGEVFATAAAYAAVAISVYAFDWSLTNELSPLWPAAGIGVGAVWVLGWHASLGVVIGAIAAASLNGIELGVAIPGAVSDGASALFGGLLLKRPCCRAFAESLHRTVLFVVLIGLGSGVVDGALDAMAWLLRDDGAGRALNTLALTSLTNSLGVITIVPVIAALRSGFARSSMRLRWLSFTLIQICIGALTLAEIWLSGQGDLDRVHPLVFLYLPILILGAFLHLALGTALTTLHAVAGISIATAAGLGPFKSGDPSADLVQLSIYLWVITLTPMLVSSALSERIIILDRLRRANRRSAILSAELDHRVRNNLGSLIGLIAVAESRPGEKSDFARELRGRVEAMAEVYTVLRQEGLDTTTLGSLLNRLTPEEHRHRVEVRGDAINAGISHDQLRGIGSVLYELFSNAHRHGALGTESGHVVVDASWAESGQRGDGLPDRLLIEWSERGTAQTDPSEIEIGWGLQIVRDIVAFEFLGSCDFRFTAGEVRHKLELSLRGVAETSS